MIKAIEFHWFLCIFMRVKELNTCTGDFYDKRPVLLLEWIWYKHFQTLKIASQCCILYTTISCNIERGSVDILPYPLAASKKKSCMLLHCILMLQETLAILYAVPFTYVNVHIQLKSYLHSNYLNINLLYSILLNTSYPLLVLANCIDNLENVIRLK